MSLKLALIGPGRTFESGITHYTDWLQEHLAPDVTIRIRDLLPKFLFPGRARVERKAESGICIDWYDPVSWLHALWHIFNTDILLIEYWSSAANHMYLFLSLLYPGKVILEMHEISEPTEAHNVFLRAYTWLTRNVLLWRANAVVVHSRYDEKQLDANNMWIIPHPIYNQYPRLPIEKSKNFFDVVFFGLVREYKGVKYLIEGFLKAKIPGSRLWIGGEIWDPIDIPESWDIIASRKYLDRVGVSFLFTRADVVVLPYTRASQSGVAHIAMSFGLPILATDVGGLPDALGDYAGWWPIISEDSDDIAEALKEVYANKESERNFRIPERLQDENIVSEWKYLFRSVIE